MAPENARIWQFMAPEIVIFWRFMAPETAIMALSLVFCLFFIIPLTLAIHIVQEMYT